MNSELTEFARAWQEVWATMPGDAPETDTSDPARLADTPAYPLARMVVMPAGHSYDSGALSFRMTDLQLHGISRLDPAGCALESDADRLRLTLLLPLVQLRALYVLEAKPDPVIELDTAGNLLELPAEALRPLGAGAQDAGDDVLDTDQEEWLDQARDQRTRLSQTTNGQKLLGLYDEHNETYNTVFRENPALIPLWQAGGATREMAGDTSDAVKNDTVINDAQKKYSGDITYNGNAFVQQLNVSSACVWTDPEFDPATGPGANSKYWAAAKAALSFGKGVNATTNNSKDNVNEMRPSEVHGTVEGHDGDLPAVGDDELGDVVAIGVAPAGEDVAVDLGWIVIDEEDRSRLRYLFNATMKQRAENAAIRGQPLFAGECAASIGAVAATVELLLEAGPTGRRARATAASIDLPAFELEIDDSHWSGAAGSVARQRLERMYFIRSLLHDAIVGRLDQLLRGATERACNATLRDA